MTHTVKSACLRRFMVEQRGHLGTRKLGDGMRKLKRKLKRKESV